jgi:hypothetical protein
VLATELHRSHLALQVFILVLFGVTPAAHRYGCRHACCYSCCIFRLHFIVHVLLDSRVTIWNWDTEANGRHYQRFAEYRVCFSTPISLKAIRVNSTYLFEIDAFMRSSQPVYPCPIIDRWASRLAGFRSIRSDCCRHYLWILACHSMRPGPRMRASPGVTRETRCIAICIRSSLAREPAAIVALGVIEVTLSELPVSR